MPMAKAKKSTEEKSTGHKIKNPAPKKIAKKDIPLKVNMTFEELLRMAANTPPKKKKK